MVEITSIPMTGKVILYWLAQGEYSLRKGLMVVPRVHQQSKRRRLEKRLLDILKENQRSGVKKAKREECLNERGVARNVDC